MPTDPDCIFCKIVAGDVPCFKLYEDQTTLAFMDVNPANEGHALSISKPHWEDLAAIPPDVLAAAAMTAQRVAKAVVETLRPDGVNLIQANGKGAAQSVPHFHFHIMPRRTGDGLTLNWTPRAGDMDKIKALAARIGERM